MTETWTKMTSMINGVQQTLGHLSLTYTNPGQLPPPVKRPLPFRDVVPISTDIYSIFHVYETLRVAFLMVSF